MNKLIKKKRGEQNKLLIRPQSILIQAGKEKKEKFIFSDVVGMKRF